MITPHNITGYPDRYHRWTAAMLVMMICALLLPYTAHAQTISDGAGSVNACGLDFSSDCKEHPFEVEFVATESGNPDTGLKVTARVFSATVCQVETTIAEVYTDMWCTVSEEIEEPLAALITLYVVIFGIMVTLGMVQLTTQEALSRLLKIGLIWVFATLSAYGITIMYQFYMLVLQEGIGIVLGTAANPEYSSVENIMHRLDVLAGQIFASNQMNLEGRALTAIAGAIMVGSTMPGGPSIGYALITISIMTFLVFARTVLTYLIAVIGLAFYLSLSPIFISLAMFKVTNPMFERWLSQTGSFALQPILIFAYLMLAEGYIEHFLDEFPNMEELMNQVGTLENNTMIGSLVRNQPTHVFMDDPNCLDPNENCPFINPDTDWQEGLGDLMELMAGMLGMVLVNFATIKFLDLCPEVARQLSSGAARAIRIGGGLASASFRPSGATLQAPTDGMFDRMIEGVRRSDGSNIGERWADGVEAAASHLRTDSIRRATPDE